MKKICVYILMTVALYAFMFTGCAKGGTEKAANTDKGSSAGMSQEIQQTQDTKNQDESAAESTDTNSNEENQSSTENCVQAQWAEDVFTDLSDYEQFRLGMDEELPLVYFSTEQTVKDFKVLHLTLESVDDDGNVDFTIEETYTLEELTPDMPLLARMELIGTIPNNGISYVDANGKVRYFTVDVSGYDGSLLLTEFSPQN